MMSVGKKIVVMMQMIVTRNSNVTKVQYADKYTDFGTFWGAEISGISRIYVKMKYGPPTLIFCRWNILEIATLL